MSRIRAPVDAHGTAHPATVGVAMTDAAILPPGHAPSAHPVPERRHKPLIRKDVCSGTRVATAVVSPERCPGMANGEISMNWDRVEGNWKQFKGKVKEQWGRLTDDDLDVIDGKKDQLAGKIQESYGVSKDEANSQIDRWARDWRDETTSTRM